MFIMRWNPLQQEPCFRTGIKQEQEQEQEREQEQEHTTIEAVKFSHKDNSVNQSLETF